MPLVTSKTELDALIAEARKCAVVGFDTETTGFNWHSGDKLVGVSFCFDGVTGYYVQGPLIERMGKLFSDPNVIKVAHNAKFDLHFLRTAGIKVVNPVHDTEALARIENENRPNYKLKDLCRGFFGDQAGATQDDLKAYMKEHGIESYGAVPVEIMAPYACQDAVLVVKMYNLLLDSLHKQDREYEAPPNMDSLEELLNREAKVLRVVERMEATGSLVDLNFLDEYKDQLSEEAEKHRLELVNISGEPDTNWDSDEQVGKVMLKLGWLPNERTATGAPKVDKYALEAWDHPFSETMQKYRRATKLISTYCEGIKSRAVNVVDGIGELHPDFRINGATTGRMSCTNPNMQNTDKKSEGRKAFIPRPGYTNFYLDFKQIEICGFAYYANDKLMQDTLWEGADYHRLNAVAMYDKPAEQVTDEERTKAKTFNFALLYGAGEKKIAKMLKVTQEEAGTFKRRYMDKFPAVRKLRWRCENAIRTRGFVCNRFGRRRRLLAEECYKSMNALIQSWAADLLKEALIRIDEALIPYEADILLQIHDEVVIQIKDGPEQMQALRAAVDAMTSVGELVNTVPVRVDIEFSKKNWHEQEGIRYEDLPAVHGGGI